jgi:hypothetical protein
MKTIDVELRGIQPMLQHSPRGVDPTDPLVREMKAITSQGTRKKSEADLEKQDWLEFQINLYWNGKFVYVPDRSVIGTIRSGAKHNRRGRAVDAGVDVEAEDVPLLYEGPRDPRELYEARFVDRRPVGVQQARVMRVRPRFDQWALRFRLLVDESIVNISDVRTALELGGQRDGIGDHRPRFGRFEVTQWLMAE